MVTPQPTRKDRILMASDELATLATAGVVAAAIAIGMGIAALLGLFAVARRHVERIDPAVVAAAVKAALLAELERGPVAFRPVRIEWSAADKVDPAAYAAAAAEFRREHERNPHPTLLGTGRPSSTPAAPPTAAPSSSTTSSAAAPAAADTPPPPAPSPAVGARPEDRAGPPAGLGAQLSSDTAAAGPAVSPSVEQLQRATLRPVTPDPAPPYTGGRHVATQAFPVVPPRAASSSTSTSSTGESPAVALGPVVAPSAPHRRAAAYPAADVAAHPLAWPGGPAAWERGHL